MSPQNNSLEYTILSAISPSRCANGALFCAENRALTLFTGFESKEEKLDQPNASLQVFDIVNGTGKILKDAPLCIRHLGSR